MILLIVLAGLWIGLYISTNYIVFLLISLILFIFIIKRFSKKISILFIACLAIGFVTSFISFDHTKESFTGVVIESKENYYLFSSSLEKLYVYEKDNAKEVGDVLTLAGSKEPLNFSTIESGFDFNSYLNSKGIKYKLNVNSEEIIINSVLRIKSIKNKFLSTFDNNVSPMVANMLFGMNEDSLLKDNLSSLHLYRIFTIGGVFVNCFIYLFTYIYKIKFKEDKAKILSLITLTPFFILSLDKFSVFRILFVNILLLINNTILKKKFSYLTVLSFSAILILIFDYHYAYQDGFILGYLISIFIHLISISFLHLSKKKRSLAISIFIFLFFIPFEVSYYQEISLVSPLLSTLLLPLFVLINVFNLLCLYGLPLQIVVNFLINATNNFFNLISINSLALYSSSFTLFIGFMYELTLIMLFYYQSIKFKPFIKLFSFILTTIILIKFVPYSSIYEKKIYFINVGQGDSTLIINKNKTILIDTGGSVYQDVAKECLIPFFKKEQIYKIDYLIITHNDYDHSGALESLKNNFNVGYEINNYDFPIKIDDLTLYNLNHYSTNNRDDNDSSYVISFNFINLDFLLMGDASKSIENTILNKHIDIKADILKVGHHGSNTSSSFNFIKKVMPKEAIISCGKDNKYGHPSYEVINILSYFDIKIRRTDIEGTICYKG